MAVKESQPTSTLPIAVTTVEALAALHSELRQWVAIRDEAEQLDAHFAVSHAAYSVVQAEVDRRRERVEIAISTLETATKGGAR